VVAELEEDDVGVGSTLEEEVGSGLEEEVGSGLEEEDSEEEVGIGSVLVNSSSSLKVFTVSPLIITEY